MIDWTGKPLVVDEDVPLPVDEEMPEEEIIKFLDSLDQKRDRKYKIIPNPARRREPVKIIPNTGRHNRPGDHPMSTGGTVPSDALVAKLAQDVHARAVAHADVITADIQEHLATGAELIGLENRVKTESSLARKIRQDSINKQITAEAAASDIFDSVRFTQVSHADRMTADCNRTLNGLRGDGYQVVQVKNTWQNTVGNPYQGVNVKLRHQSGLQVEMQFHTPESFEVKTELHGLYDQQKVAVPGSAEWAKINDQMLASSGGLTVPTDVHSIRHALMIMKAARHGSPGDPGYSQKHPGGAGSAKLGVGDAQKLEAQARAGGFTYGVAGKTSPKGGYSVSPYPERSRVIDTKDLTRDQIKSYADDNADLLSQPDHYLGGWRDTEGGKDQVWLDVSIVKASQADAEAVARDHNQKAIYDLEGGATIDTGGTGEAA